MAENVALGIANDGATGTSPLAMRKCLSSLWQYTGVIEGLAVSGTNSLSYYVGPGTAICTRNGRAGIRNDGVSWAPWDGGNTPAVSANTSAYPRVDVIWICARDKQQGDSSNYVQLGVTQGNPSSTGSWPAAPSYATVIEYRIMPAGATTTNASIWADHYIDRAVPYGASLGVLVDKTYTAQHEWLQRYTEKPVVTASFAVPTRRIISVGLTVSVQADGCAQDLYWAGSGYVQWFIDGFKWRTFRFDCNPYSVSCFYFEDYCGVDAGNHTVKMSIWGSTTKPVSDLYLCYGGNDNWPGQRMVVTDMGLNQG